MRNRCAVSICALMVGLSVAGSAVGKSATLSRAVLQDKIKGGWAGQAVGCTFGGPTEFRSRSTFIQDYQPIIWDDSRLKWYYDNVPGLYDDVYMDLTFVQVFEKEGLDAPAEKFALAFANAGYMLWHANQAARYNILNGVMPPRSGDWRYNPHAEDIDFQIEADFAGLMSPGMPNAASEFCDRIGHIMNYGDGWYGGVYVAAMYSLAFVSSDIDYVVTEALKAIPKESTYHQCMADTIRWCKAYPDDWKMAWFRVQEKWGQDVGCPEGVFDTFNIDAKINSAWIILGLLYGRGDFGKTLSISARCGDDSDCNPASAGGILGTILGYDTIPAFWKQGLDQVEDRDLPYTTMSLNDTYSMSFRHALEVVKRNGGSVADDAVTIPVQEPRPVRLEVGFAGHYPVQRRSVGGRLQDARTIEFEGIGFALSGSASRKGPDYVFEVRMSIDGKPVETSKVPTSYRERKDTLFWRYQLPKGPHKVELKVLNPTDSAEIRLGDLIVYSDAPAHPPY
jgi:hypothetical protein